MGDVDDLTLDYRVAFLQYLPRRAESALTLGYELGRRAIANQVSLLDLVQIHHVVLAELLADTPADEAGAVTVAASEFLVEVLSTFDMTHRSIRSGPVETADSAD